MDNLKHSEVRKYYEVCFYRFLKYSLISFIFDMPVEMIIFLSIFDKYSCRKLSVKSAEATFIASIPSEFKNFALSIS